MNTKKISFFILFFIPFFAFSQKGESNYKSLCATCHTIGKGKLVGPDLKGVTDRRSEAWLLKWIKSSQTLVKSGDTTAVKLFEEYNKIPMPDVAYNEAEIKDILAYISTESKGGAVVVKKEKMLAPDHPITNAETHLVVQKTEKTLLNTMDFTGYVILYLTSLFLFIGWVAILANKTIKQMKRKSSLNP